MKRLLVKNGRIVTMSAQGTLENGQLLIEDGKICAVGQHLDAQGAQEYDAQGGYVLPGLIDAHCHVGIYETAIGFPGDDGNEISAPVTPQIRGIDGINPFDPESPSLREVVSRPWRPGRAVPIPLPGNLSPCAHGGVLWMKWCSARRWP